MRAPLVVLLLPLAACVATAAPQRATTPTVIVVEQPVLRAYVQTLAEWMTPEERAALARVDFSDTTQGDPQRLRYLAADRIVRGLLPRALEARNDVTLTRYAAALRRLPPLLDEDTDAFAAPFVRLAMRGLAQSLAGEAVMEPVARPAAEPVAARALDAEMEQAIGASTLVDDLLPPVDPEAEREVAEAMASYAEAYARHRGVSALEADAIAAAAADVVDSALLHQRAVEAWGVPREIIVEDALSLASDMAGAARRRERLPRRERAPSPQIPPDAPGSPTRP